MATPLEKQILDLVQTKLAGITVANGYESAMVAANIHRPPEPPSEIQSANCPAIVVRHNGTNVRWHLRGAEELMLEVELVCVAATRAALEALIADVKKLIYANQLWNNGSVNLARRTWIVEDRVHETEVDEDAVTGSVVIHIFARADRSNPFNTKAV